MKKPKQKTQNTKLVVALSLLLLVVVGTLVFFGSNLYQKVAKVYYGHVTRSAYHREYKNLQPALERMALNENKDAASSCKVEAIALDGVNVSDVLFCGLHTDNYVEITEANKHQILSAAAQLDELSGQYGGRVQTNIDTTFGDYVEDIANGVDYNPDFGATFVRDNYLCAVRLNVAYSNPAPPAYSIQFGCNAPRVTDDDSYLLPPCTSSCDEEV